jgi:hypothetical protein
LAGRATRLWPGTPATARASGCASLARADDDCASAWPCTSPTSMPRATRPASWPAPPTQAAVTCLSPGSRRWARWRGRRSSARPDDDMGLGIAVDSSGVYVTGMRGRQPQRPALCGRLTTRLWRGTRTRAPGSGHGCSGRALGRLGLLGRAGSRAAACSSPATQAARWAARPTPAATTCSWPASSSSGALQWTRLFGTADRRLWPVHRRGRRRGSSAYVAGEHRLARCTASRASAARDLFVLKLQYACAAGLTGTASPAPTSTSAPRARTTATRPTPPAPTRPARSPAPATPASPADGVICVPSHAGTLQWARQAGSTKR